MGAFSIYGARRVLVRTETLLQWHFYLKVISNSISAQHNIYTKLRYIYVGAFAWKSLLMVQQNIAIAHLLVSYGCAPFTRLLQFYMPNDFDFPCLKMISLLYMKSSQLETPLFITTYSMVLSLFWIIKRLLLANIGMHISYILDFVMTASFF